MSTTFQAYVTPAPNSHEPIEPPSPSSPPRSPLLSPTGDSKGRKLGLRRSISNLFLHIRPGSGSPDSSRAASPVPSLTSLDSLSSDDAAFAELRDNGWDIEAIKRRGKGYKTASARERAEILGLYDTLQADLGKKPAKEKLKEAKKASHRLLRILSLCVLEHDDRNFPQLLKIMKSKQMSFITFIQHIPDFRKPGAEYMKTFLVAAFVNWKQFEPSEIEEAERTFTDFLYSMSRYDNGEPRTLSVHARANIIYAVQYLHHSENMERFQLTSKDYDAPYISPFSKSWEPTGIPQARVDQVKSGEKAISGFFEVHSSEERKMIEKGQDSKPKTKEPVPDDEQATQRPSAPPPEVQYMGKNFLGQTGLQTDGHIGLTEEPAEISEGPAVLVETAPSVDDREVCPTTIQFKHLKGKIEALQQSLGLKKSEIPMAVEFTEKRPDKTWEWTVESGVLDLKTGCAEFEFESRNGKTVNYNFWITPWAIVGERLVDGVSRGVYLFSWR